MLNPERYVGKPFLRFLECFVLKAIGELSKSDEALLERAAPHLRKTFGVDGSWDQIVASQMDLDESIPEQIRQLWIRNRDNVRAHGEELIPQDFAEIFVDGHFQSDDADEKRGWSFD